MAGGTSTAAGAIKENSLLLLIIILPLPLPPSSSSQHPSQGGREGPGNGSRLRGKNIYITEKLPSDNKWISAAKNTTTTIGAAFVGSRSQHNREEILSADTSLGWSEIPTSGLTSPDPPRTPEDMSLGPEAVLCPGRRGRREGRESGRRGGKTTETGEEKTGKRRKLLIRIFLTNHLPDFMYYFFLIHYLIDFHIFSKHFFYIFIRIYLITESSKLSLLRLRIFGSVNTIHKHR